MHCSYCLNAQTGLHIYCLHAAKSDCLFSDEFSAMRGWACKVLCYCKNTCNLTSEEVTVELPPNLGVHLDTLSF